ncbi:hypothetical protein LTR37_009383 [Vermiconidia calcicola]|uniref:Uncharacterized protein n=1 Tax=Vermiconidia calcicola TaxID=1690605 RepID=A0ACC3N802_9PEZI|nr:hypothetical protein LTR37_009383 [Vermiconidia calcicola]
MSPPYTPKVEVEGSFYYPYPYSLNPLPKILRHGLIPVGILAALSVGATLTLIAFILWRVMTWKMHYRTFLGYNQYVILVLNLLLADLQQSAAFLVSFHWIRTGMILAPSKPCFAQAWMLHSGDVSSGFFVLAIAVHTFYTAVHGQRVGHKTFASVIVCIWAFAYFLTGIGVGLHGHQYFVRAGAWCWVSETYEQERLAFHYIWVFIVQFGTILIYVLTFIMLRKKTSQVFAQAQQSGDMPNVATVKAVNRITALMTLYPCVYVLLTLPLSVGRMWSMAHGGAAYGDAYACVAGAMITSCGWVDSLLYTLTRRRLLRDTMPATSSRRTRGSDLDNDMGSKGITHTRTVTVEGGQMMDTLSLSLISYSRANSGAASAPHTTDYAFEHPPSPSGSIEPILPDQRPNGKNKKRMSARSQELSLERQETEDEIAPLPPGWVRHRES